MDMISVSSRLALESSYTTADSRGSSHMWLMSHLTPVGSLELAKLALANLIGLFECGRQKVRPNLASTLPDGYGEINPKYLGSVPSGVTGLMPSQNRTHQQPKSIGWVSQLLSVQNCCFTACCSVFHQKRLISQWALTKTWIWSPGSSWMSQS